jgi:Transposase IS66 family/RNase_H superfamily
VEVFLDIEGVPDRQGYSLIGVLVCQADTTTPYAFWADTAQEERHIWQQFVGLVGQYPDAPIYHYGSYEPRALATLAKRSHTDSEHLPTRLVNVNQYIYGKVYFPVRSNRLKEIGHFIGAEWTSPHASGLQSLVWRHHWEKTHGAQYRELLVTYNREDCHALKLLTDELSKIKHSADTLSEVNFANHYKRRTTEVGEDIHGEFEAILEFASMKYDKNKIYFRHDKEEEKNNHNAQKVSNKRGKKPKARKFTRVPLGEFCPKHQDEKLRLTERMSNRLIIDLILTKSGIKKTRTVYVGIQGYCSRCRRAYAPPDIRGYGRSQLYGHGFRAWVVYQRIAMRLPHRSIVEMANEQFNEKISAAFVQASINDFSHYYAETESIIIQHLLQSSFIHADETPVNIRGVSQYLWVFTDGKHVLFKLRESREATIVYEFLAAYQGTLISDFYPGYDSVQCRQQKCWVHLIRDLNDDLWGCDRSLPKPYAACCLC